MSGAAAHSSARWLRGCTCSAREDDSARSTGAAVLHGLWRSSVRSSRMLGQGGRSGGRAVFAGTPRSDWSSHGSFMAAGTVGRDPNGTFLSATPMPERVLYVEPLRRRMSVELGASVIARSDDAVILFEPARYPVAYFPIGDIDQTVLHPSDHEGTHQDLGKTKWFNIVGDGEITRRGAWEHVDPPARAAALRGTVRSHGTRWTPSTKRTSGFSATPPIRITASTSAAPLATLLCDRSGHRGHPRAPGAL